MGDIIHLDEFRLLKDMKTKEAFREKFIEEATPGSVVHLGLDRQLYWDRRTGQIATEPDFPHNFPLQDFVGWLFLDWDPKIGPKLSPFSPILMTGDRINTGYVFPWEYVLGYKVHYKHEFLFE